MERPEHPGESGEDDTANGQFRYNSGRIDHNSTIYIEGIWTVAHT